MSFLKYLALIVLCTALKAGNNPAYESIRADLKKVNAAYASMKGLSMDTYYKVFADHQSQSMIEGKKGRYVKFSDNLFTSIDGIDTYVLNDKVISVNKGSKRIVVGDNRHINLSPLQTDMDTLLRFCESIKVYQLGAHEKRYCLVFNEASGFEYSQVDVHLDPENARYLKVVLYYTQKMNLRADVYALEKAPRLEIEYGNLKQLEAPPALFDANLYVTAVNDRLKPASGYYNYKVLDLRNQTRIKNQAKTK